jgi:hypothetical protein
MKKSFTLDFVFTFSSEIKAEVCHIYCSTREQIVRFIEFQSITDMGTQVHFTTTNKGL